MRSFPTFILSGGRSQQNTPAEQSESSPQTPLHRYTLPDNYPKDVMQYLTATGDAVASTEIGNKLVRTIFDHLILKHIDKETNP